MGLIPQKNPWGAAGSNLDTQRTDLWSVDLHAVLAGLTQAIQAGGNAAATQLLESFPDSKTAPFYARTVGLSDVTTDSAMTYNQTVPFAWPAYDQVVGQVKMSFIVDTAKERDVPTMLAVMAAWRAVVRAGRAGTLPGEPFVALGAGGIIPDFQWNIPVYLLRGLETPDLDAPVGSSNGLDVSTALIIYNAWLGSFQYPQLNHESAHVVEVPVWLYVQAVLPRTVGQVNIGPLTTFG